MNTNSDELIKLLIDKDVDLTMKCRNESNFEYLCRIKQIKIIKYYLKKNPYLAENLLIQFVTYRDQIPSLIKLLSELYFMKLAHFKAY